MEQIKHTSTVVASEDPAKIEEAEKMLFMEMCEICLWGNATDLSLLTSLSYEDIQKLQGSNARKESEKNILVNDLSAAFSILSEAKKTGKRSRVSIVLDNAGFELFVDLILAGYLLSEGLASEIVLHPKSIPWFVSDVVPKDFVDLLSALADPQAFYAALSEHDSGKSPDLLTDEEVTNMKFLFDNWSHLHSEGKLILRPSRFWTHAGSYWRMPHTAPEVLEDLKECELVIFKGDLNYRKLTGDVSPIFLPFDRDFLLISDAGCLGSNHPVQREPWSTWRGIWCPVTGSANLQSRCGGRIATRSRRRDQTDRRRWWRLGGEEVGMER